MVATIAGVGVCVECLEKRYDLNDDGQCGSCERFFSRAVPPAPPWPTDALPGTPEKVAVMAARAASGFAVLHPGDAVEHPLPALNVTTNWAPFRPLDVSVYKAAV